MSRPKWNHALLVVGIVLVAMNLRPAVTALSPLAERMHLGGMSRQAIGSLTTVPLLMFGIVGLWAGWIGGRVGLARALGVGLFLLGSGCFVRSIPGPGAEVWRMAGTVLIGAGIALGNVLLPGIVKSRYPNHVGLLTSFYSTAMNLGAAFGIVLAAPLADALPGDWNWSLASWGVFALASLAVWLPQMRPRPTVHPPTRPLAGVAVLAGRRRAWEVAAFMGLQSIVFYSSIAWLPTVLQTRGMTEVGAAGWVSGMQVLGCAASLVVPTLAGRRKSQSAWAAGCALLNVAGLLGILFLPLAWTGISVLVLGLGVNASFGLALLVIALRSRDPETAAALSSLAQAAGYVLAAPGPWVVGWLSTTAGGWNLAFGFVVLLALAAAVAGFRAGREGEFGLSGPSSG
ncbi:MAG: MFS transporter [Verrucomicrobiales bacterium]